MKEEHFTTRGECLPPILFIPFSYPCSILLVFPSILLFPLVYSTTAECLQLLEDLAKSTSARLTLTRTLTYIIVYKTYDRSVLDD
jgi:hypothetical protein